MGEPAPKCATAFVSASASGLGGTKSRLARCITRGGGSIASARHPGRKLLDCAKAPQSGVRRVASRRPGDPCARSSTGEKERNERAASATLILTPHRNVWRLARAERAAVLIDAGRYFGALRQALI